VDAKDLAYKDYMDGMKYQDIANKYGVSINTVKSWKQRNDWNRKKSAPDAPAEKGRTQKKKGAHKKGRVGAPYGNKNAVGNKGGAAPAGNLNAVKHGAYQTIYADYLPEAEKEVYEQMPGDADLEAEIRLLRLKIARLLNRQEDFFYDMWGNKHDKEVSEEDREAGILACIKQLEKIVRTQDQIQKGALAVEEQKARIAKLKAETKRIAEDKGNVDKTIHVTLSSEVEQYAD